MSDSATDLCIRVECLPHARDDEGPIRLMMLTDGGETLARVTFTPAQARASVHGLTCILGRFLPIESARRIGDGLLTAAITVWAARN